MNKDLMESFVSSFKTKEDAVNFVASMYDAAKKEKKPAEKEKYYMLVVERFNPHTKNYDYDPVVGLNMTLIYSKNPQEVQAQGDVLIQLSEDAEFDNKVCILAIDEELCMSMDRKFKKFCSELTNLTNDISAVADKYACPSKILSLGTYPKTPSKEILLKRFLIVNLLVMHLHSIMKRQNSFLSQEQMQITLMTATAIVMKMRMIIGMMMKMKMIGSFNHCNDFYL